MNEKLKKYKKYEEESQMIGWDFSALKSKMDEDKLSFDYIRIINQYRKK